MKTKKLQHKGGKTIAIETTKPTYQNKMIRFQ